MSEKQNKSLLNKFTGSQIASLIAVIVSVSALAVSIYEAQIMREQQSVMVSQQKTSVWPYVKGNTLLSFDTISTIKVILENKGIGPALINDIQLSINGELAVDYIDLRDKIGAVFKENKFYVSLSSLNEHVLSPGEVLELMSVRFPSFPDDYIIVSGMEIGYDLCYCSVYEECWKVNTRGGIPNCN
jgi:hypothetical protein